jgi:adenylate kinase
MAKLVTVAGVTGVGKDYLLDSSLANMPHIQRRNFGTELGLYLSTNKETLSTVEGHDDVKKAVIEISKKMDLLRPLFLSSHVIRNLGAAANAMEIESIMRPELYVVVMAPPDLIYERVRCRNAEGRRDSTPRDVGYIDELQKYQLSVVKDVCSVLGSDLVIIENLPGQNELMKNTQVLQKIASTITE